MPVADLVTQTGAVFKHLADNWSETPIAWPDVPFDPPDGSWLRVSVQWGDGFAITIDGVNDVIGVLFLDVFTKPRGGPAEAYRLAGLARGLFNRETTVGGFVFGVPSGPSRGTETEWIHAQVSVPFRISEQVEFA